MDALLRVVLPLCSGEVSMHIVEDTCKTGHKALTYHCSKLTKKSVKEKDDDDDNRSEVEDDDDDDEDSKQMKDSKKKNILNGYTYAVESEDTETQYEAFFVKLLSENKIALSI